MSYRHRSGEVDVVSGTRLAGMVEQPKESHALVPASSAPDGDDDATGLGRTGELLCRSGEEFIQRQSRL